MISIERGVIMQPEEIIEAIKKEAPEIKSVYFVGCGASKAELYPAKYFLEKNSRKLRIGHYTANEFVHATPAAVDGSAIVITCSLGGNTPETVEAARLAGELGAHVIAVTHKADSPLARNAKYVLVHGFEKNYAAKLEKMNYTLWIAAEILRAYEGYDHYEDMKKALGMIDDIIENAVKHVGPAAEAFAQAYKDAPVVYTMSSGPSQCVAYTFSLCLMMEMQWINSGTFHDGEFFHGPFEIVDKNVPFIIIMNDGPTRALDTRALTFLQRFNALTTVIDGKDYGVGSLPESVKEYFNPMVVSAVLRVYAEHISDLRNHPLTMRRYMWKLEY